MSQIILLYSTTDGHTREICRFLKQEIEQSGHRVTLTCIDDDPAVELNDFEKIVIGASIRYGKHSKKAINFIKTNTPQLEQKPNAFFSVNVVARKAEKNQPDTNPYLKKFLAGITWKPRELGVFAGKIDYPKYSFWDRNLIRFIMWMTKGPTDPNSSIEFTDWEQVKKFAQLISKM